LGALDSRTARMTKKANRINATKFPPIIVGHAMGSGKVVKDESSLNIDFSSIESIGVKSEHNNLKYESVHN